MTVQELAEANHQALTLLLTGNRELWTIVAISFSASLRAPLALGLAFLLAHLCFPGRRLLISAFNTLLALPAVVVGLTVYMLLSRNGPLGDLRLLFTQTAMIVGQIILCLPLLVADRRAWERRPSPSAPSPGRPC